MTERFDVVVVGAGPAGAVCAAHCAQAGLRTLLLEKTKFPREKVCGDCVNPACWPVFDRLGISERVLALPHARLAEVDFIGTRGQSLVCALPPAARGEIAVKRSLLDQLLLDRAVECGATVQDGVTVTNISRSGEWEIDTTSGRFSTKCLVAADGRNSTVARLLELLPSARRDRVGLQTHFPLPPAERGRVVMRFLPMGYCGLADVGDGVGNLCLVSRPNDLAAIRAWAEGHFGLPPAQEWRSITPLRRAAISPRCGDLLLAGDAARVVEPFTGEGIYYALATGELAARHIIAGDLAGYAKAHAALYRGRLWINELARLACLHPRVADVLLATAQPWPPLLRMLTRKVVAV